MKRKLFLTGNSIFSIKTLSSYFPQFILMEEVLNPVNLPELLSQAIKNSTTNNQNANRGRSPLGSKFSEIHELTMIIIWLTAITIGLWSIGFKQYKCAVYVHFFIMGIVTVIAWMSGFLALITFGVNHKIGAFHTWLGITILIVTTLQAIGGMVCWWLQKASTVRPITVKILNYLHTIFGWILFILVLIELLDATRKSDKYFIPIIVISLVSSVFYLIFKFCRRKMGTKSGYRKLKNQHSLLSVKNSQDLAFMNDDYFIFADKVYDLHKVLANHPGGYDVIKKIKGREVDRFIYGAQTLQGEKSLTPYAHTSNSIALAGSPVGILHSINPYQNLYGPTEAIIQHQYQPAVNPIIYAPFLASLDKSQPFLLKGYSDISQLGKHYALTICGISNITRLYSVVNFMNPSNIQFMSRIMGRVMSREQSPDSYRSNFNMISNQSLPQLSQRNVIPLLMKKYKNGSFTSKFLTGDEKKKLTISPPQGRGLSLHEIPPSQIVFMAGGTGIYPFCDMIDLLYKQVLLSSGSTYRDQILQSNPILKTSSLVKNFKVTLYYSAQNAEEIIESVLYQINQLCSMGVMEAFIKANENGHLISGKYPSIMRLYKKFEEFIPEIVQKMNKVSQIYLCGPPGMTNNVVQTLIQNQVPTFKYRIL